jgi:hypothetical protein
MDKQTGVGTDNPTPVIISVCDGNNNIFKNQYFLGG